MEKAEAKIYFPEADATSLEEQYEDKLFEWKQFFVHRFPVAKLYKAKLKKVSQIEAAYTSLAGEVHDPSTVAFYNDYSNNLKSAFLQFEQQRSRFKQMLFQCTSLSDIVALVESFLISVSLYAESWNIEGLDTEGVLISKELDPMDLLNALNEAEKLGILFKNDLSKLPDDHLLIRESKRLSLWVKMESNG